jgi:hypothetical protein
MRFTGSTFGIDPAFDLPPQNATSPDVARPSCERKRSRSRNLQNSHARRRDLYIRARGIALSCLARDSIRSRNESTLSRARGTNAGISRGKQAGSNTKHVETSRNPLAHARALLLPLFFSRTIRLPLHDFASPFVSRKWRRRVRCGHRSESSSEGTATHTSSRPTSNIKSGASLRA